MVSENQDDSANDPPFKNALDKFFRGLNEFIFHSKLGVVDVQLVEYLNDLVMRFVRVESLHRVRQNNGKPVTEVFQMLYQAEKRIGLAKREVHRHIGDFTLFWSGMYPESLRRTKPNSGSDWFKDYCSHGKRSYAIAARIDGGEDRPPSSLLSRLSEHFELCAYGLREVRREIEDSRDGDAGLLF